MRFRGTLFAVLLVSVLAACGSGEKVSSPSATTEAKAPAADGPDLTDAEFDDRTGESEVRLDVRDNSFNPEYIEVKAGTPITFANRGRTEHNVLPVTEGAFATIEAEDLAPGDEQTLTFAKAGDYAYYCSLHGTKTKGMVGAIRVVE
jgi:plastocyanin